MCFSFFGSYTYINISIRLLQLYGYYSYTLGYIYTGTIAIGQMG